MRTITLSAAVGLGLIGCATPQQGKLYPNDGASPASFRIANTSSLSPFVEADLGGGVSCRGRLAHTHGSEPSSCVEGSSPDAETSVAVLVCSSHAILKCRLLGETDSGYAYGECKDQLGHGYTIVF